jgi:hypothetical protein
MHDDDDDGGGDDRINDADDDTPAIVVTKACVREKEAAHAASTKIADCAVAEVFMRVLLIELVVPIQWRGLVDGELNLAQLALAH